LRGPHAAAVPNGYELLTYVGRGSFADVWRVRHRRSGQMRALKIMRDEWRDKPAALRLISNEANAGRRVRSPHVVRAHEANTRVPRPYIVLDWVSGSSLEQVLTEHARLPVHYSLWIARQCAVGLCDLERAGFAHGDVKPANILLSADGTAKLIDLGFVRPVQKIQAERRRKSESVSGTAYYLAPEALTLAGSNPVTKDIYSLGVTLFRMLAGWLPFTGDSTPDVLRLQRESRPPMLRSFCPEASQALADLVRRLLAKQPLRRPASLAELLRELIRLELDSVRDFSSQVRYSGLF